MDTYVELAKEMGMVNALLLSPDEIVFDIRTLLKCHWGCENYDNTSYKCQKRDTAPADRMAMVKAYNTILMIHGHSGRDVSRAALEIERRAFLDGHHLAFAIRYCNLCKSCAADDGKPCVQPLKVRPCEAIFGIDVYRTAARFDLPCYPLKDKDEPQNRYGFICID